MREPQVSGVPLEAQVVLERHRHAGERAGVLARGDPAVDLRRRGRGPRGSNSSR